MKKYLLLLTLLACCLLASCTSLPDAKSFGAQTYYGTYYDVNSNLLIPDQTGNAGLVLGTNGTNTLWVAGGGGGMIPLTSAHLYVGNALNVATDVAATGDLTVDNTGLFTVTGIQGHGVTLATGYLHYDTGTTSWSFGAGGSGITSVDTGTPSNITGIVTGNGSILGSITDNSATWNTALQSAGTSPGTYNNVTVAASGLVTSGSNVAYLTSAGTSAGTYNNVTVATSGLVTSGSNVSYQSPLTFSDSLTNTGGTVTLVNDAASPAASYYYGTNSGGTLGYFALPTSGMSNPMTTLGDIIYENSTPTADRLAGNTSNTDKFLRSLSVAGVAQAPSWQSVTKADVGLSAVENTALSTWAGTSNIITVGTITTGTWSGSTITPAKGGTGVANGTNNTITFTGNYTLGLTLSNNTALTLPTSGTLVALDGTNSWTNTQTFAASGIRLLGSSTGYTTFASANSSATNYTLTFPAITDTLVSLTATQTLTNKTLTTPIIQVSLTAGENIAAYDACYVKSDGKVYKAKGNSATTMPATLIAQVAVNINDAGNFMGYGYITNAGWAFTPGATLYVSQTTAGLVTSTAPNASGNQIQVVGIAITATQMAWNPAALVFGVQ